MKHFLALMVSFAFVAPGNAPAQGYLPKGVAVDPSEIPDIILPRVDPLLNQRSIRAEIEQSGPVDIGEDSSRQSSHPSPTPAHEKRSVSQKEEPLRFGNKSAVLYSRKKAGNARLTLSSPEDSLVKVVDLATNRLAVIVWIVGGSRKFDILNLPESTYAILSMRGLSKNGDGNVYFDSLWKSSSVDLTEPFAVAQYDLSVIGASGLKVADLALWRKFNPPKSKLD